MIIKGILIVLTFVFAILGLCELIHAIRLIFLSPTKKSGIYSVLVLYPEKAVSQISFAAEQLSWLGSDFAEYAVAVTDGIDDRELTSCKEAAEEKNIVFCKFEELAQVIEYLKK